MEAEMISWQSLLACQELCLSFYMRLRMYLLKAPSNPKNPIDFFYCVDFFIGFFYLLVKFHKVVDWN